MADLLTGHLPPVTLEDMIAEVERELAFRNYVYPNLVAKRRMKQGDADEHMRRMLAVRDTLTNLRGTIP
jgi:hypothetical protein